MKKLILLFLLFFMFCNICFADCDWTQIKKLPNGDYEYSPTLHLCVGNLVQDNATKTQQLEDLTKALDLKNAALIAADQRTAMWEKTSDDQLQRLNTIESEQKHNDWLYFGLGALTVIGAGFMTARLIGH